MQQIGEQPAFELGQIVATPGALAALEKAGQQPSEYLIRHVDRDWGNLSDDDRKENDGSLEHGFRLLSVYRTVARDSLWISPALLAQIDCADGGAEASVDAPAPIWHEHKASPKSAVVIDLPGADSIRLALVLAERGYRPVPIISASPGPVGLQLNCLPKPANVSPQSIVVLDMSSLGREICVGTAFLQKPTFASGAPSVFILDALRLRGTNPIRDDRFDNRSMVFPQYFPSARFLVERKIKRVTLVQAEKTQPSEDLSHVLLRWQEAGVEILAKTKGDVDAPSGITVSRPSSFKASWYRALVMRGLRRSSVGSFGSFIPETSAAG